MGLDTDSTEGVLVSHGVVELDVSIDCSFKDAGIGIGLAMVHFVFHSPENPSQAMMAAGFQSTIIASKQSLMAEG